jgi:SAM-dependent methyltransferase
LGVDYSSADQSQRIGEGKSHLFHRMLKELADRGPIGNLLDIGSNFGAFLEHARQAGWNAQGFEPNETAAAAARERGFTIGSAWNLDACDFRDEQFQAVTSIDVFYYSRHPYQELSTYRRLLRPGGLLVMRLANRRALLSACNRIVRGDTRDKWLSRIVLDHFHSIAPHSLRQILLSAGFDQVTIRSSALTAPWGELSWKSRLAYAGGEVVNQATLGQIHLSPGILLIARKGS